MKLARLTAATLLLSTFAASHSMAQVAEKKSINHDGARRVISAAVDAARQKNATGVIAVVDDGGNLVAMERLDGTFAAGALVSYGKARTAALFKKPTRFFEEIIKSGRTPMIALNDFTPLQGGVPIEVDGQIVGAVGVSGASSAQQDDEIASAAAKSFVSGFASPATATTTPEKPVGYYPADRVDASFDAGAILFQDPSVNYAVHTSQRTGPGQAEVHAKETDVIRIIHGTAILVTGGSVVAPKPTAADEIRGTETAGGEGRRLNPGDVVIVPAGVPHWFKEVSAPFHYYVVKVRDLPTAADARAMR